MSERAQESRPKKVPAVAEPRPMSLVSRKPPEREETSSIDSSASNSLGGQKLDQSSVSRGTGKLMRDRSQDPSTHSREWQQDDTQFRRKHRETGARYR